MLKLDHNTNLTLRVYLGSTYFAEIEKLSAESTVNKCKS